MRGNKSDMRKIIVLTYKSMEVAISLKRAGEVKTGSFWS